jgi:hypothetical protein
MTGPLILPGAPTLSNQAATKGYVDSVFDINFGELDYLSLCMSVNTRLNNTTAASPFDVIFDKVNSIGGQITHSSVTGAIRLKAGKVYHLRASLGGTGRCYYAWMNWPTLVDIPESSVGSMVGVDDGINTIAECILKPTVDRSVILRQWGSSGTVTVHAPARQNFSSGWVTVVQIR